MQSNEDKMHKAICWMPCANIRRSADCALLLSEVGENFVMPTAPQD